MRQGLRFGLRAEPVATLGEPVAQLLEVLDDAVVDDRDLTGAVDVGMGVEIVGAPVGRPAGVGQADRRRRRRFEQRRAQVGELSRALLDEQLALGRHQRDAGGVVAAVLEAGEPFHEDGRRLSRSDVSDDAAHDGG